MKTSISEAQNEGTYFSAYCSVTKGSLPLFFNWSKNGQKISQNHIKISSSDEMSSKLSIMKVSSSDSGNYSCNVRNDYGTDNHVFPLIIKGICSLI